VKSDRPKKKATKTVAPSRIFETRTHAWREVGLGDEISASDSGRAWPRLIIYSILIAAVLIAFDHRQEWFPGYGTEARIVTAVLLFAFGWGFASALGKTLTPSLMKRLDPGTAGTVIFAVKLLAIVLIGVVALKIAGVKTSTLAVGGAFTAVVIGLAAQQTLGNVFAGVVLQATRPFQVGQRVRLSGIGVTNPIEGTVSSLGLFYSTFLEKDERTLIPNSMLLNLTVVPLREPPGIDIKARFDSHVTPAEVQKMLDQAVTVPTRRPPSIWLDEIDRDEVVLRIIATPVDPDDGATLAEQVVSVTRGTFEYETPDDGPESKEPDSSVPYGHA
jgi:small-conductance mechanosensitive channel